MSEFDAFCGHYQDDLDRLLGQVGSDTLEFARRKADWLVKLSLKHLGPPSTQRILDVGCGTGNVEIFLQDCFQEVVGLEVAQSLLVEARTKVPRASFVGLAEGADWPFPDSQFDIAFCACVWHHIRDADLPPLCSKLARIVRPGGLVVVFEHNPYNPITRKIVRECELDRDIERLLPLKQVCQLLDDAGLRVVDRIFISFFPGKLRALYPLESLLTWFPLGGQYLVAARRD